MVKRKIISNSSCLINNVLRNNEMGIQKLLHIMFLPTKIWQNWAKFFFATKSLTRMEPRKFIKSQLQDVFRQKYELYGNPFSTIVATAVLCRYRLLFCVAIGCCSVSLAVAVLCRYRLLFCVDGGCCSVSLSVAVLCR